MKKTETSSKKSVKKKPTLEVKKPKNLFDHLTAIRTTKDPDYYDSLNEAEKKGFNHWAILNGLSMDINLIELIAFLWKDGYYDKIPSPQFYRLLAELVPQTTQRLFWVKKSKQKNTELLKNVANWYSVSTREAEDYVNTFVETDDGCKELVNILQGLGLSEKEAGKLLEGDE
jgi:hypothetical protein